MNILEACRHNEIEHLVYASSSSVYGANKKMPFQPRIMQIILLVCMQQQKSNELTYIQPLIWNTYNWIKFLQCMVLWGPDMALFLFTKAILNDEPISF